MLNESVAQCVFVLPPLLGVRRWIETLRLKEPVDELFCSYWANFWNKVIDMGWPAVNNTATPTMTHTNIVVKCVIGWVPTHPAIKPSKENERNVVVGRH